MSEPSRHVRLAARSGVAIVLVLSACSSSSPELSSHPTPAGRTFYVSLGASLAVGFQPGQGKTDVGYVDQLGESVRETVPGLELRKFGCGGESTRSMTTGQHSLCRKYATRSQLDTAVAFLRDHRGGVSFITIDIGAQELVDECFDFDRGQFDPRCVADLLPQMGERLTSIVDALRKAAGSDVPVLGMTYYNPLLGLWGHVPHGEDLARKAAGIWKDFNATLTEAYQAGGAVVADVATTFRIDDFGSTTVVKGAGRVPVNVALTCKWTWFCSDTSFGDPHANETGYGKIAETFNRELQPLLG